MKNRCEFWVQSETLYLTNSFKNSVPATGFLGIPECRKIYACVDESLHDDNTRKAVLYDPWYVWKRAAVLFGVKFLCFERKSRSRWLFNEWIMSHLWESARARCMSEYEGKNDRQFAHLPIDSHLLWYLALICDVMWCGLFACEEAAQAREKSLTKGKKWSNL